MTSTAGEIELFFSKSDRSIFSLTEFTDLTCSFDFDKDGFITREDVRLILSHIPIVSAKAGSGIKEGQYTSEGGGR